VLLLQSEWLRKGHGDIQDAIASVNAALVEGYEAALRIQSSYPEALVGIADAKSEWARCAEAMGSDDDARRLWAEAAAAFQTAISQALERLGGLEERNDVKYNYACALAKSQNLEESAALLQALLASGAQDINSAAHDSDLLALHQYGFFATWNSK
jgi:hypothetical protein